MLCHLNNSGNNNLKLANINVWLSSGKAAFATQAKLADIDATSLSASTYSDVLTTPALPLQLTGDARDFATKDGKDLCEGYMAVLPTAVDAFESAYDLLIELSLTDGTNSYLVTKTYNVGADLSFFQNGLEQGKGSYFQLEAAVADLVPITGTSYAVGDYWSDDTNPEGVVFWMKPGTLGPQGKVVALGETHVTKWGLEIDEHTAGVTGVRSFTDGATDTKSMIARYKSSPIFGVDYSAFHYIYATMNGGDENGVWYLPARDELKMLFAGASGKVYENITCWQDNNMPGYDSPKCIAARTAFDTKIVQKGGSAFGSSGNSVNWWYLSSTEGSDLDYASLNFEKGTYSYDLQIYDGNIRWIREF